MKIGDMRMIAMTISSGDDPVVIVSNDFVEGDIGRIVTIMVIDERHNAALLCQLPDMHADELIDKLVEDQQARRQR